MQAARRGEVGEWGVAARQASWQFAIFAGTGLLNVANGPGRPALVVALCAFVAMALALRLAPPRLWGPRGVGALTVVLLVSLGISTWSAGDRAIVTGPGYIVAFAWMGLHQRARPILLSLPFALAAYSMALWLAHTPFELASSAIIVILVAGLVGLVLSNAVEEARRSKAEVRTEERWRAALMATLAHDVRSPLTSVLGALEVIEDDPQTPAHHRLLAQGASRQAARILRLAVGLLEVERVDQGRLSLDRRHVPLLDLITDIARSHPALDLEIDVAPNVLVWADPERLEQILVNLINNAVRHGSSPLVVRATTDSDGLHVSVRDHGTGVPGPEVQHLFEKFSSADHSPQSVGLGLWIVRLLTEAHGGEVRYEHADPGARFIVSLPPGPAVVEADSESCPHLVPL